MENNRPLGWTTLEEAKRLVDAGLDPNTADMYYEALHGECDENSIAYTFGETLENYSVLKRDFPDAKDMPCWSLGALIELMPYEITYKEDIYRILITQKYVSYPRLTTLWPSLYDAKSDSAIESAVNIIITLIENGHIKKHE